MGITKNQKAQIDKLTQGNSAAQARIQARVNKLLESKGKKPVMKLAPGGDVQYGSMYDKLAAEQQGQTEPIITQPVMPVEPIITQPVMPIEPMPPVDPVPPIAPVDPVPPTSAGATAPQLTTPDNLTTTYAIDDPRNPNYVAPAPRPTDPPPETTQPITPDPIIEVPKPGIPGQGEPILFEPDEGVDETTGKPVSPDTPDAYGNPGTGFDPDTGIKLRYATKLGDDGTYYKAPIDINSSVYFEFGGATLTGPKDSYKIGVRGDGKFMVRTTKGSSVVILDDSQAMLEWTKENVTSSYDPESGPPELEKVELLEDLGLNDLNTSIKTPVQGFIDKGEFPEDPLDFEITGSRYNWLVTYADGKTITSKTKKLVNAEYLVRVQIAPVINEIKETESFKSYKDKVNNFNEETKIYENFIDEKYKPKDTDPNAVVDYKAELDALQKDLAQQSTLVTTMPTGVAPPAAGEDGVVPEDTRTYEEKAQYEANQAALKKYAETQTKTTVAQSNLKSAGIDSGDELMASIQEDPTSMVTKQEVSKLADKVEDNQFIDKDTGQVTTKSQAGVTTVSGTAVADDPTAVDAGEYSADKVTTEAKKELEDLTGAESLGPSKTVVGEQGELGTDAQADEAMKVNEDRISKVKETTDLLVATNQLAEFKGQDYANVVADIAVSDALTAAKAQTDTVKFEELPPPAIIAEENMAQAKAMQDAGLVPDAIAVAANLATFTVSDGTLALAMEGSVQALDTVEGQLSKLMKSFDDGTPSWASGALRAANAALAGRGLGASSMAATAVLTAAMESALPIAQQDAQVFNNMNLTNLNNRQQVSLSNAAAQQGLSLANLSNEQQANLQKSANAFALQTQNLSNRQTVEVSNAQIRATLQGKNLDNTQQSNIAIAARYAEAANINLSNKQQAAMQDSVGALQTNLANLTAKSQSYITSANLAANLQGQVLTNDQQVAITNAARYSEVSNITFSADQQRVLHNSSLMQSIGLAELSTEQAAVLQNAANFAGMDMANLSNLQQAQVENAKNFLNIDLANLTNDQQAVMFKAQATQQALLSDQAAENAALNFNASSENQVNQFNESMKAQVSQFNAAQTNAIAQFNAGEMNAVEKFNTQLESDRLKFNAQNSLIVEQANTKWRQDIATIDAAAENSANAAAAAAANQMTQAAVGETWQQERDLLDFAFTASESEADRNNNIIVQKMSGDATVDAYKMKAELEADAQIGTALLNLAFSL